MVSDTLRPNNGGGLRPRLLALDELSGGGSQVHSPPALTSVSHHSPTLCVTPWRLLVLLTAFQRHIQLMMPTKNTPNARACQKHAKRRYPQSADAGPKGCATAADRTGVQISLRPRERCHCRLLNERGRARNGMLVNHQHLGHYLSWPCKIPQPPPGHRVRPREAVDHQRPVFHARH